MKGMIEYNIRIVISGFGLWKMISQIFEQVKKKKKKLKKSWEEEDQHERK